MCTLIYGIIVRTQKVLFRPPPIYNPYIKNANKILSHKSHNDLLYITHFNDHKNVRQLFNRTSFRLAIIGTVWPLFSNFNMKSHKSGLWNILPMIERNPKRTPKNKKKMKIRARHKHYMLN